MPEEKIYAVAKTGIILTEDNIKYVHEEDENDWFDAVEEYKQKKVKSGLIEKALSKQSKDKLPIYSKKEMEAFFDSRLYHKILVEKCRKTYINYHLRESIVNGSLAVLNEIKKRTGRVDLDGNDLADLVFSPDKPILEVYSFQRGDSSEQQGVHFLFKGFVFAIRNQFMHREIHLGNPFIALEYLSFLNFLLITLENMHLNDESRDKNYYKKSKFGE